MRLRRPCGGGEGEDAGWGLARTGVPRRHVHCAGAPLLVGPSES